MSARAVVRLVVALLALAWSTPAAAQCFGASAELALDGSGTYNLTLGSAVSSGDALFASITQLEEASTVTGLTDSINGGTIANWNVSAAGDDGGGTARNYQMVRLASASGTPVITITMSAGSGGTARAWACPAAKTNTFEEWNTPNIQGSATSPLTTPTGNATCSSGVITGVIWSNAARDVSSVDIGANLSPITGRQHIVYFEFSSSGSVGPINATMSSTARGISNLAVLCAAGGSPAKPRRLTNLRVGP